MQDNGRRVAKFTMGLSILYLPFFLMAHFLASISDYPADGYSFIYVYTIHLATLFFVLIGFVLLRKILLSWLEDRVVAATLLLVGVGTNLYFFTVYDSPMSHGYLFSLYCLLIYATQKWYVKQRRVHAVLVGIAAGFITLIRPTEIISLFIPLLWGIHSLAGFRERFQFIGQHYRSYLLSCLAYVLVGLPQLIYWKWASGHWLFYSYGDEGFDFANPELLNGLFSFYNGWLAYTPLMFFSLAGIYYMFRKKHPALLPILIFLPIHIYITYSWWCWNYIRGMGSRPMVETYALLSIPLAFLIHHLFRSNWFIKGLVSIVFVFFIGQNMIQTTQVSKGLLWPQASNWAFYKQTIGKQKLDYLDIVTFDTAKTPPDESAISRLSLIGELNFEDSLSTHYRNEIPGNLSRIYYLDNQKKYSPGISKKIADLADIRAGDWLRVSVDAMRQYDGNFMYRMSLLVVAINPGKKWISTRIDNKVGNKLGNLWDGRANVWGNVYFWVQIPEGIEPSDELKCYVWNELAQPIYLDNLKIELWR